MGRQREGRRGGRLRFRRALILLHRDAGFLALGLTVVYAISGIAVNHRHDWDASYQTDVLTHEVGTPAALLGGDAPEARLCVLRDSPEAVTDAEVETLERRLTAALGRAAPPKSRVWRGPDELALFYETGGRDTVTYHLAAGTVEESRRTERWLLRDLNFLHLNEGGKGWTIAADVYAGLLLFLALSGPFMVKGRRVLLGRGGLLLLLGVVVPIIAVLLLR